MAAQSVCRHALRTCGHYVCDGCLLGHVRVRVMDEGDLALLVCPAEGCRETIDSVGVERVLEQDADAAARYRQLRSHATVTQNAAVSWCPAAGCEASLERPAHVHCRHVAVTCVCGTSFCFACKASPPHEPATCAAWERLKGENGSVVQRAERESEAWIQSQTTRCTGCSSPVQRSAGCNHMRCTQCHNEFCFACGAAWAPMHYGCARPDHPDDAEARSSSPSDGQLLEWCLGGYNIWEGKLQARTLEFWTRLAVLPDSAAAQAVARLAEKSRYWIPLTQALATVTTAQRDMEYGCLIMSRSFAVDLAIPEGFDYIRARRLLRTLRAGLEVDLQPLSKLLVPESGLGGRGADVSYPMALLYVLQTEAEVARDVLRLSRRVRRQAQRLAAAGRAGVLLAPSSKTSTAVFLASEALSIGRTKVKELLVGVNKWWQRRL